MNKRGRIDDGEIFPSDPKNLKLWMESTSAPLEHLDPEKRRSATSVRSGMLRVRVVCNPEPSVRPATHARMATYRGTLPPSHSSASTINRSCTGFPSVYDSVLFVVSYLCS